MGAECASESDSSSPHLQPRALEFVFFGRAGVDDDEASPTRNPDIGMARRRQGFAAHRNDPDVTDKLDARSAILDRIDLADSSGDLFQRRVSTVAEGVKSLSRT